MILLTGATGLVGSALLRRLLESGQEVRCLVREPRRLGPNRVRVQITLGDLADPMAIRQAVRGVDQVVHLAASIRAQPGAGIEELNGLATVRLLREAQRAGSRRFVFFGAIGATLSSRSALFRAKALAERAVMEAEIDSVVLSPSMVYAPGDPFMTLLRRMSWLPWMPIAGSGLARYRPIWSEDVADCALAVLMQPQLGGHDRIELAGPDELSYEAIARLVLDACGRRRPLVHVPLGVTRRGLRLIESVAGEAAFATWEEAELMAVSMTTPSGTAGALRLGVKPKPMRDVLGLA